MIFIIKLQVFFFLPILDSGKYLPVGNTIKAKKARGRPSFEFY